MEAASVDWGLSGQVRDRHGRELGHRSVDGARAGRGRCFGAARGARRGEAQRAGGATQKAGGRAEIARVDLEDIEATASAARARRQGLRLAPRHRADGQPVRPATARGHVDRVDGAAVAHERRRAARDHESRRPAPRRRARRSCSSARRPAPWASRAARPTRPPRAPWTRSRGRSPSSSRRTASASTSSCRATCARPCCSRTSTRTRATRTGSSGARRVARIGGPDEVVDEHPLHALATLEVRRRRHPGRRRWLDCPIGPSRWCRKRSVPEPRAPLPRWSGDAGVRSRLRMPRFSAIWVATAVLFAVSPLLASGSVSSSALLSMLPFAGHPRDRRHRPDARHPAARPRPVRAGDDHADDDHRHAGSRTAHESKLPAAIGLVVLACVASGSSAASRSRGSGSRRSSPRSASTRCCTGVVFQITSGASTSPPAGARQLRARRRRLGIPNTVLIARRDPDRRRDHPRRRCVGRRFVAVGASPAAAHAAGMRVRAYEVGHVHRREHHLRRRRHPRRRIPAARRASRRQRLPAAHDRGRRARRHVARRAASAAWSRPAGGALFLTQLEQVVLGMGAPASVQFVIQGSIIALGMAAAERRARGGRACAACHGARPRRSTAWRAATVSARRFDPRLNRLPTSPAADDPTPARDVLDDVARPATSRARHPRPGSRRSLNVREVHSEATR